jgi:aldehyde:ferredoxin oxidoreductase
MRLFLLRKRRKKKVKEEIDRMPNGFAGGTINIELTEEKINKGKLNTDRMRDLIGGKGLGAELLYKNLEKNADPLGPGNILLVMTGPLTGTSPACNRTIIVTKSPLTGTYCDTYAGGHFGPELKFAGYDYLMLKGKASSPVYIWIDDDNVELRNAEHLWGKDTHETELMIKKELGDSRIHVACIGPAGENLVKFAHVNIDLYRQAARGGAGTVLGSKNVKAVAVRGTGKIRLADWKGYMKAVAEITKIYKTDGGAQAFTQFATASAVNYANLHGVFPTYNFYEDVFEDAENLSGEAQREKVWTRDTACFACPIRCSKMAEVNSGKYKGSVVEGVEYETVGMMGSNLGIGDLEALVYLNELSDKLGLDTLSAGNVIGFAIECYQKGIITSKDTGGLELKFGDPEVVIELLKLIAHRKGFGALLAKGVKELAKIWNQDSIDFAMEVKGLELPAWSPRGSPGQSLAYATADRGGCHQRGWPIAAECEGLPSKLGEPLERYTIKGKPEYLINDQNFLSATYATGACEFVRTIELFSTPEGLVRLIPLVIGWDMTEDEFMKVGERIWNLIRLFNIREGFTRKDDTLPKRVLEEPIPSGPSKGFNLGTEKFEEMLSTYYKLRGWDKTGIPTNEKLEELGLRKYR